ncbi:hypothetical protein WAI453_000050 [Rhynchosporium graminicola]
MAPKPGTPLSTVEVSSSENTTVSLFYLDASNNIILATYISALSGLDLTLRNTFIIVPSTGVHPNTQLAAIYLSSAFGYRLYYQSPSSVLQELVVDNTGWHNGEVLPVAAIAGSPLSVTITKVESPTPRLVVFYVDDKTRTLFSVTYYIEWKLGVALSTTALYAWTTNTALASITQTNSVYIRAYYIGSDKEIYEMLDPGAGTVWSTDSDRDPNWPKADFSAAGGLVGIGWDDQVRVYYLSGGVVKQLSVSGGNWHVWDDLGQ